MQMPRVHHWELISSPLVGWINALTLTSLLQLLWITEYGTEFQIWWTFINSCLIWKCEGWPWGGARRMGIPVLKAYFESGKQLPVGAQWSQEVETMQLLTESLKYWHVRSQCGCLEGSARGSKNRPKQTFAQDKWRETHPLCAPPPLWKHSHRLLTSLFPRFYCYGPGWAHSNDLYGCSSVWPNAR